VYQNIPDDLKAIPNFVVWKYENRSEGKPTKVPYDPKTGQLASVTNPDTWGTFEQALIAAPYCSGIGFVLTEEAGFSCIDLDYTTDTELAHTQAKIETAFQSYSEISPSGKGLHIWVKGIIPSGRRRGPIEVYSSARYMTMTGNVYRPVSIQHRQDLLTSLWAEMETRTEVTNSGLNADQTKDDTEIYTIAAGAVNGEKFVDLFKGEWQKYYSSQSEADFALINILAFYTQNRVQITRMFRNSGLGQRAKALRVNYTESMINRSFDRMPPEIDMDALKNSLEAQLSSKKPKSQKAVQGSSEASSLVPPAGLIGEIAKFIYAAAPRPVPEIAIAGAIGLMAGICGRAYNISGMGLNQYVLLLANTGAGKEAISSGIDKLMNYVRPTCLDCMGFIGPSEIASPQALIKYLSKKSSSFCSLVGEFGLTLKQISSERANPNQIGLRRAMLELYGKSGQGKLYKPIIYSDKEKNTDIVDGPAFSMIGESTPERFYEVLNESMIYEGLLPRFTVIEYNGPRTEMNLNHQMAVPSQTLVEYLAALCAHAINMNNSNRVELVTLDPEAQAMFDRFNSHCDKQINSAHNEITRNLWNRAHVKALKLASLLAVGVNYTRPSIDVSQAVWSINLIEADVKTMLNRFENGDIGTPQIQNEQLKDIYKAFKKYLTEDWPNVEKYPGATHSTHHNKVVPQSFITAFCRARASFKHDRLGPIQAIKTTLLSLIDCGELQELSMSDKERLQLGKNGRVYAVSPGVRWLH